MFPLLILRDIILYCKFKKTNYNSQSIFNAYIADDVAKIYTAENRKNKLIISQHGGHIGTSPFAYEEHQS